MICHELRAVYFTKIMNRFVFFIIDDIVFSSSSSIGSISIDPAYEVCSMVRVETEFFLSPDQMSHIKKVPGVKECTIFAPLEYKITRTRAVPWSEIVGKIAQIISEPDSANAEQV